MRKIEIELCKNKFVGVLSMVRDGMGCVCEREKEMEF